MRASSAGASRSSKAARRPSRRWSHELADYLIGKDPAPIEDHWTVLYRGGFYRGGADPYERHGRHRPGAVGHQGQGARRAGARAAGRPGARQDARSIPGSAATGRTTWSTGAARRRGARLQRRQDERHRGAALIDTHAKVDAAVDRVARRARGGRDRTSASASTSTAACTGRWPRCWPSELEPYRLMFIEEPVLQRTCRSAARHRRASTIDADRAGRAALLALGLQARSSSDGLRRHHPARPVARRRHHRDAARSRRWPKPTTSRWRRIARSGPIALAACLQLDAVCYNAFIQEQSLGIHYNQGNDLLDYLVDPSVFAYADGHVAIPQGPGLGIAINEDAVIKAAQTGHRWRPPQWRHGDGSFAEW